MRRGGNVSRRLREIGHLFSVTFFLFIVGRRLEGGRGAKVVREALDMEQTLAFVTGLYGLCMAIELGIAQAGLQKLGTAGTAGAGQITFGWTK